jgi:lipid II:glycine glycyltransferase (peptidoglycan interpeptide bridge formation enzyme)
MEPMSPEPAAAAAPEPEDRGATFDAATLRVDDRAWDRFVAAATAPSYLQASPWAEVKRPNGWTATRVVAETPNGPVGAQILVRRPRPLPWGFGYEAR